ncbi:uncharacterized protein N7473_002628 [Penicillium subrubescens]|uniref:uncharacterized protein n=1 Tax=Penicillium subrubescens TaxID=1316194 RepID=UPI0025458DC5|nr:uncharacterized protein N7473_002628 [Penicillium subrubescens]KAJ5905712.1 hypothetical protein N7473_002628 [Penicillium subrubescens]
MRPKTPKIEASRPSAWWLRRYSGQGTHAQALSGPTDQPAASPRELLAIIPDNPGVLMHRIAIRPQHSPNFVRLHQEGYVTWAGKWTPPLLHT